jgi:hypothetical protein
LPVAARRHGALHFPCAAHCIYIAQFIADDQEKAYVPVFICGRDRAARSGREGHLGVLPRDPLRGACCAGEERGLFVDALEGGKDAPHVVARDAVEVEEGGVEFGQQFGALGLVPLVEPAAVFRLETATGEAARLGHPKAI